MPLSDIELTRLPRRATSRHHTAIDSLAPPDDEETLARVLRDMDDSLRSVNVNVTHIIQRCQRLLRQLPEELPHRDVLHLRARVEGIEQCTRDAEQALARVRSRVASHEDPRTTAASSPVGARPLPSTAASQATRSDLEAYTSRTDR